MELRPLECLLPSCDKKIILTILNQPLKPQLELFKTLWKKAVFKVTVDGGTNELFECTSGSSDYIPDLITGDFDSAKLDILQFYKDKGVEIVETPDQDFTDFTKSIKATIEKTKQLNVDLIVVLGAFGGRLDQTFANINTLYEVQNLSSIPVILLSDNSMATVLKQGEHRLFVDTGRESEWCGLIPLGLPCQHVTTTGLKWNLENQALQFGQLISTSNTYNGSDVVTIATDESLLWTMGFKTE